MVSTLVMANRSKTRPGASPPKPVARLATVLFAQLQGFEDSGSGGARFGLRFRMDFQQPVQAFDDLQARTDLVGLKGHVSDAVDLNARRNLNPERSIIR